MGLGRTGERKWVEEVRLEDLWRAEIEIMGGVSEGFVVQRPRANTRAESGLARSISPDSDRSQWVAERAEQRK